MMLSSGKLLTPENVHLKDTRMDLDDILIGLSRQPRFGGHTNRWWSVLHHTVACHCIHIQNEKWGPPEYRLMTAHVLLHDAHEAVVGDIPSTWKTSERTFMERGIDKVVFNSFNVPPLNEQQKGWIKWVDLQALAAEAELYGPKGLTEHHTIPVASDGALGVVETIGDLAKTEDHRKYLIGAARDMFTRYVVQPYARKVSNVERTTELL